MVRSIVLLMYEKRRINFTAVFAPLQYDRVFNDKTGMIFACAKIALTEWFFAIYAFLRFNVSIRQLEAETRCLLRNYGNIGNLALWSTETSVNEQTAHRDGD